ncbi:hypothetical protein CU633_06310 [Bacillus sp. V3-13]|uniref:hypothetical protein n=1 Tax=Bacillus sp. V3-13 TaxID=2053728 RepID=UPI000C76E39F|nr:hypothetical protein [Bacillus sp. V3-13]PLR78130.1 hypothetical protein CU633_06310 [Bacillus sp. V3-13]
MKRNSWFILLFIAVIALTIWFFYLKVIDNRHAGMSIIPEQEDDIPLFEGLEPNEHDYVLAGNRVNDIYDFYERELPKNGWKVSQKPILEMNQDNHESSFYSQWKKSGFDGELSVSAHYNKQEGRTEVVFDKTPIHTFTTWITKIPDHICIYGNSPNEECTEINDKDTINEIVYFINHAIDWDKKASSREKISEIDFGNLKVNVSFGADRAIYLQSDKGTKYMKPEREFLELLNIQE